MVAFQFLSLSALLKSCGSPIVAKQPYRIVPYANFFSFRIPSYNLVLGLVIISVVGAKNPGEGGTENPGGDVSS
jgi:hypothetical protein